MFCLLGFGNGLKPKEDLWGNTEKHLELREEETTDIKKKSWVPREPVKEPEDILGWTGRDDDDDSHYSQSGMTHTDTKSREGCLGGFPRDMCWSLGVLQRGHSKEPSKLILAQSYSPEGLQPTLWDRPQLTSLLCGTFCKPWMEASSESFKLLSKVYRRSITFYSSGLWDMETWSHSQKTPEIHWGSHCN